MKTRALTIASCLLLAISLAAPASASSVPSGALQALNWSGYALAGRMFTGVAGTFDVPIPPKSAPCIEQTAVWVGIDGLDNHDLLQAGIVETAFELPSSSRAVEWSEPGLMCPGRVQVYAFWEDLPSGPVRTALPVKAGDDVSVSIFKMSPGWWALAVHDITTGRSWLLSQPYGGPATSAEWVVEAPQVMGIVTDPVPFRMVHFSDLRAQGNLNGLKRISSSSKGHFSSSPGPVANMKQLMQTGFTVHWAP
jgi:hypothetical protein